MYTLGMWIEEAEVNPNDCPQSYKDTLTSPHRKLWRELMEDEVNALFKLGVIKLAPPLETIDDKNVVLPCVWHYCIKTQREVVVQLKARLCANGSSWKPDSVNDVYSPIIRGSTLKILLTLAAQHGARVWAGDIPTAYCHAKMNPTGPKVYIQQAPGFKSKDKPHWLWKLKMNLYGWPPAGRNWYFCLQDDLLKMGFEQSLADLCLFVYWEKPNHLMLGTIVDNLPWYATCSNLEQRVVVHLQKCFEMKYFRDIDWLIGMGIQQLLNHEIHIEQHNYIQLILDKYEHLIGWKVSTPGEPGTHIQPGPKDYESALPICSILGSLIYACNTHIDLTYAVSHACKDQSCPSPELEHVLCWILSYLKSAPHFGIRYTQLPGWKQGEPLQLTGCCDTSFADLHDCKCSYSYFVLLNGCLISWVAKVMKIVLLLTAEAEYFVLTEVIKEILGVKNVLKTVGLKVKIPISVYCNNLPVIHLTNNPMTKTKTQHINIKFHWICEHIENGTIIVHHTPTEEQAADFLTKALPRPIHQKHILKLLYSILLQKSQNEGKC